jgi:hypothetical protein
MLGNFSSGTNMWLHAYMPVCNGLMYIALTNRVYLLNLRRHCFRYSVRYTRT